MHIYVGRNSRCWFQPKIDTKWISLVKMLKNELGLVKHSKTNKGNQTEAGKYTQKIVTYMCTCTVRPLYKTFDHKGFGSG